MEEAFWRGWENLIGRWEGPMALRLIFQPIMASFFAIRSGLRDARAGNPPFLQTIFFEPHQRPNLFREGWKDVGKVFVIAICLDSIYQIRVHSAIFAGELLVTATVLALLPYVVLRGLVTRIARHRTDGREGYSS